MCTKRGPKPPFLGKRGLQPIFEWLLQKVLIPKILTEFPFGIGMVCNYREIPIHTDQKIPIRDATLLWTEGHDRPLFYELLWRLVTSTIFVRC